MTREVLRAPDPPGRTAERAFKSQVRATTLFRGWVVVATKAGAPTHHD